MFLRITLVFIFALIANTTQAGWLVTEATIKEISNTAANYDLFYIEVEGGNGLCANQQIRFPRSHVASDNVHQMGFSIALAAYMSGQKVKVYDYDEGNESCQGGDSIRIYK